MTASILKLKIQTRCFRWSTLFTRRSLPRWPMLLFAGLRSRIFRRSLIWVFVRFVRTRHRFTVSKIELIFVSLVMSWHMRVRIKMSVVLMRGVGGYMLLEATIIEALFQMLDRCVSASVWLIQKGTTSTTIEWQVKRTALSVQWTLLKTKKTARAAWSLLNQLMP